MISKGKEKRHYKFDVTISSKRKINKLIVVLILFLLIFVLSLLKSVPYIAEYVFARGISRAIITVASALTSWIPFALYEILALFGIVCIVITIVNCVKYIKYKRYYKIYDAISKIIIAIFSVILIYTMSASFSYYREPVENYLPQAEYKMSETELFEMTNYFLEDLNNLSKSFKRDENGNIIPPYSYSELSRRMQKEFERLDSPYFNPFNVRAKRLASSHFFAFFGIAGVSFQPTGEAGVSYLTPAIDMPSLIAHEMAHTKGCMYESDAELVAAYITLTSEDDYIRYSGYSSYLSGNLYDILYYNEVEYYKIEMDFLFKRSTEFLTEKMNSYKYYEKHYGAFDDIGTFINDLYLKMSGAKDGTGSYIDDSGTIDNPILDDEGTIIDYERTIYYSNIQKLLLAIYAQNK